MPAEGAVRASIRGSGSPPSITALMVLTAFATVKRDRRGKGGDSRGKGEERWKTGRRERQKKGKRGTKEGKERETEEGKERETEEGKERETEEGKEREMEEGREEGKRWKRIK